MQPITFLFDYEFTNDRTRPYIMESFANCGATNQVLSDTLISQIEADHGFLKTLLKDMRDTGQTFVDSHAPFGVWWDLDVPEPNAHTLMLERMRLAMRIVADLGVDTMTVHVGNAPAEFAGYTEQQFHDTIKSSLADLLPLAEKLNLVLCVENIWFPTNTTDKLLDMIDTFKSPNLGVCYDAGHANLMAKDRSFTTSAPISAFKRFNRPVPYDDKILETLLPHIVNCHLHDNDGQDDYHRMPGDGNIDWPHIIGLLKTAPRLRSFQSEVIPARVHAPIKKLVDVFNALLK